MASAKTTSPSPTRHSTRLGLLAASTLALCCTAAIAQPATAKTATLCGADEQVEFSCALGAKTVSLCAGKGQGKINSLAYRFGTKSKVEKEFLARPDNANRFSGTASPAGPRASVNQVWFDAGTTRYLVTQCVGGNCPHAAGLAVLRGNRVLMNARCTPQREGSLAWFARGLAEFGSDAASSVSSTELLRIEDADNRLDKLYRVKADTLE